MHDACSCMSVPPRRWDEHTGTSHPAPHLSLFLRSKNLNILGKKQISLHFTQLHFNTPT